ncbi:MAG: prolipoprotein diacylglyceryl transferase [Dehalococcoidia bacterium]|nr:prolipoprotein diacylglyceryl transferase [Dehalococcoidia bacterium]
MEIAFKIGSFAVHWYSIMIIVAVLVGIWVAMKEAERRGEDPDDVLNFMVIALPLAVVGARLYHVVSSWDFYSQNPGSIFAIWKTGGGLGIYGAMAGGALGLFIFSRWRKVNMLRWLDIIAPSLMLGQAIGRWGNYFNQELYGMPTDLPWGIYIDPAHRIYGFEQFTHFHPLFLYESILNFIGFFMLFFVSRKYGERLPKGYILLIYTIYYSVVRGSLEGMRIKSEVWTVGGVPSARWICAIAIVIAASIMVYQWRHRASQIQSQIQS